MSRPRSSNASSSAHGSSSSSASMPLRPHSHASGSGSAPLTSRVQASPVKQPKSGLLSFFKSPLSFWGSPAAGSTGGKAAGSKTHAHAAPPASSAAPASRVAGRKRGRTTRSRSSSRSNTSDDDDDDNGRDDESEDGGESKSSSSNRVNRHAAASAHDLSSKGRQPHQSSSPVLRSTPLPAERTYGYKHADGAPSLRGPFALASRPSSTAAPSSSSSSSTAAAEPRATFNGNQWVNKAGQKKAKTSAGASQQQPVKQNSQKTQAKISADAAISSPPHARKASPVLSAAAQPASKASSSSKAASRTLPISSLSHMLAPAASVQRLHQPAAAAAAAASSASVAAASTPAAAASSSSLSIVSTFSPLEFPLFPHPNARSASQFHGRSGAGSSSLTPRKQRQLLEEQQHAHAAQHNASYHSAACGTPITFVHHYHEQAAPHTYVHFRKRFKPNSQRAGGKSKGRSLQQQLSMQGQLTVSAGSTADLLARKKGAASNGHAAASASPSKALKKHASTRSYASLHAEFLALHRCTRPQESASSAWLWDSLQHPTPFANVPAADVSAASSSPAASSSSSSAPAGLSPFALPLPLHHSSIKVYFQFMDCDEDSLSVFTGLRPLVRYHRLRGLVAPSVHPPPKKPSGKPRVDASERESPDAILDALAEIDEREKEGQSAHADDDMDESDGAHSASARSVRGRSSDPASSAVAGSLFLRRLRDTRLLPTSLNTPHDLLGSDSTFFVVPLSLQLLLARFSPQLPPAWLKAAALKPKHLTLHTWSAKATGSSSWAAEDEWLSKNEAMLPHTHRRLVRLFFAHVQLPPKATGAASSSSSSVSGRVSSPLRDSVYHFNLTVFGSALLHRLYLEESCHKFIVSPDALADRLPTYYAHVVKCPLSLYDIDLRLACAYYDSPLELLQDVWRCLENALLFHHPPWHAPAGATAKQAEAAEERASNDNLPRDLAVQVRRIWTLVRTFVDEHYATFLTRTPNACAQSARTTPAYTQETLRHLRVWMTEVGQRDVQTLKLLWIRCREVETEARDDIDAAAAGGRIVRRAPQYVSQWAEYDAQAASTRADDDGNDDAASSSSASADSASSASSSSSAASASSGSEGESDGSDSDGSSPPPRKKAKSAAVAARARMVSPTGTRPTRAHPAWSGQPIDPRAPFPPPSHSRSHAARHAGNLPHALLRKLARRAGKIPYSWDARWFLVAQNR